MNWGYKIFIVIILFIAGMFGMVYVAFKQTNEMMDSNYYDKEVHYQTKIDAAKNINEVMNGDLISLEGENMKIALPISTIHEFLKGDIEFVKQDEMKYDQTVQLTPDSNGLMNLSLAKFKHGLYKARITWHADQKEYYREQNILVP